jgi:hypothetical protein
VKIRSRSSEGWKEKSNPASVLMVARPHAQRRLDAAVLAQGQFFRQQDVDGFERGDLALLEAGYDMVERFQRPRHLQADQIMADAVDRRRRGVEGAGHGRCSRAIALATAS